MLSACFYRVTVYGKNMVSMMLMYATGYMAEMVSGVESDWISECQSVLTMSAWGDCL